MFTYSKIPCETCTTSANFVYIYTKHSRCIYYYHVNVNVINKYIMLMYLLISQCLAVNNYTEVLFNKYYIKNIQF